jgi:hypothetical protein
MGVAAALSGWVHACLTEPSVNKLKEAKQMAIVPCVLELLVPDELPVLKKRFCIARRALIGPDESS